MKNKQKGLPSCSCGSEITLRTAECGEGQRPVHWAQRGLEWTLPRAGLPQGDCHVGFPGLDFSRR